MSLTDLFTIIFTIAGIAVGAIFFNFGIVWGILGAILGGLVGGNIMLIPKRIKMRKARKTMAEFSVSELKDRLYNQAIGSVHLTV